MNSAEFDPYLLLMDPDNEIIASHDDISDTNLNAVLRVTLPSNGVYIIIANTSLAAQQGRYQLQMDTALGTGDIQATLSWRSTDDLDLAILAPNEELVSFQEQVVNSGGRLDVDSNAQCRRVTSTPVENVFWPPSKAPIGEYVVAVSLYQRCTNTPGPISFTLKLNVQGTIETFQGTVDEENDITVFTTAVY